MNDELMATIKKLCTARRLRYTQHFLLRLLQRGISIADVESALANGEIIENYPTDSPYPSALVLGLSIECKALHVVCGVAPTELYLITVYYPDPAKWSADFKVRLEGTD